MFRIPLSHPPEASGETPAVDVCGALSKFSHVIVVPTVTSRFSSAKFLIEDSMD